MRKHLVKRTTENKLILELKTAKAEGTRGIRNRRLTWKYKQRQILQGIDSHIKQFDPYFVDRPGLRNSCPEH